MFKLKSSSIFVLAILSLFFVTKDAKAEIACPAGYTCILNQDYKVPQCPTGYICIPNRERGSESASDNSSKAKTPSAITAFADEGNNVHVKWNAYNGNFDYYQIVIGNSTLKKEVQVLQKVDKKQTVANSEIPWTFLEQVLEGSEARYTNYIKVNAIRYEWFSPVLVNTLKSAEFTINAKGNNDEEVGIEAKPVIYSISPSYGPVGTTVKINGAHMAGFESDLDFYFERADGKTAMLTYDYSVSGKPDGDGVKITIKEPCQKGQTIYGRYSGIPSTCDYVALTPGKYKVYTKPYGQKSNVVEFTITSGSASISPSPSPISSVIRVISPKNIEVQSYPSRMSVDKGGAVDIARYKLQASDFDLRVTNIALDFDARLWQYANSVTIKDDSGSVIASKSFTMSDFSELVVGSNYRLSIPVNYVIPKSTAKYFTVNVSTLPTSERCLSGSCAINLINTEVRIIENNGYTITLKDDSDRMFIYGGTGVNSPSPTATPAINQPSVSFIYPNTTETWYIGDTKNVSWLYTNFNPSVGGDKFVELVLVPTDGRAPVTLGTYTYPYGYQPLSIYRKTSTGRDAWLPGNYKLKLVCRSSNVDGYRSCGAEIPGYIYVKENPYATPSPSPVSAPVSDAGSSLLRATVWGAINSLLDR